RISFRRFWAIAAIARRDRPANNIAPKGDAAALSFDPSLRLRFFIGRRVKINEYRPYSSDDNGEPATDPAKKGAVAVEDVMSLGFVDADLRPGLVEELRFVLAANELRRGVFIDAGDIRGNNAGRILSSLSKVS